MNLFYTPDLNSNFYTMNEEESKHCVRVLRLAEGDTMNLIDGRGGFYLAKIVEARPKACVVEIVESQQEYGKRDIRLHIAVAPTKNIDRYEWFLEKAVEMGIDEITPLLCDNSERKILKDDRSEKIVISAMKQSYKAYMPKLNPLTSFSDFMAMPRNGLCCIAHCEDSPKKHIRQLLPSQNEVTILIGPEGDFSISEIDLAISKGYEPISLSNSRLRTETAAVFACCAVNFFNEL